ncbi:uncharacterized protein LOC118480171 [Helianthus annuus]|uniref:uncharacterized protein LOC118480171 n=1 Tax=Helianthus annuus TaxID=4232 RepID=UPI001652D05B|nr:uncharacterized protein LOC118480171 [Helianthus annuus]
MASLSKFTNMSSLVPSVQKSTVFFCNVPQHVKNAILSVMPFVEGSLPVRYLGVPLISTRLLYKDCSILVEKLEKLFILPARVIHDLEARMWNFLWTQDSSFQKGRAKVSWNSVCTPKYEGGLGIRRIGDVNKALMANHVWSIITKRKSLWVDWVHDYKLKGKSFWMVKAPTNCCWSWRKLLQLRPLIRSYIWTSLGDGRSTSAWYDTWCPLGPLGDFLTPRTITNAGFRLDDSVANIHVNGVLQWPTAWRDLFPVLIQLDHVQMVASKRDLVQWQVWVMVRHKAGMDSVDPKWDDIVDWLLVRSRSKLAANYVSRILVAASAYFIWQERNARLFKNQLRPPEQVFDSIIKTVRYKLMGVKMKRTERVKRLLGEWEILDTDSNGDGG